MRAVVTDREGTQPVDLIALKDDVLLVGLPAIIRDIRLQVPIRQGIEPPQEAAPEIILSPRGGEPVEMVCDLHHAAIISVRRTGHKTVPKDKRPWPKVPD
ncbi:hypothetical protein [Paracoccus ravus]|uniref:hypothetical protein n=1 Tax=Paracoccus ravus TaxID=2447760 RepID=UPI0014320AD8|nr:hypothetical protein [Paracoccus ravus]